MADFQRQYLSEVATQFAKLRSTAEQAMAQVGDGDFVRPLDPENNSIAVTVKHVAGNLRSRCTDFLTTDGEKPDRDRDGEFVLHPGETRAELMQAWAKGWDLLAGTVNGLTPDDLERTIYIRREPHSVTQALNRHIGHLAYHVGQIVQLAKHWAGPGWRTLTIPRVNRRPTTRAGEG
jgi:hypothetical protein